MTTTTATIAAPHRLGRIAGFVRDAALVFGREIRPDLRAPFGLVFGMLQPLVLLAFFGPLLAGLPGVGGSPWQWFVPGNLVMIGVFGTSGAGYSVLVEAGGALERVLVTPLSRAAIMIGRTLKEAMTLLVQAVLIILAVLPFGFRLHPAGVLAGLALLVVTGIGIGALSFALALAAKRAPSLFWRVHQTVLFPLLLSGVLLPVDQGPAWLATAARANPLTYVVAAERALFTGDLTAPAVGHGVLAATAIAVVGLAAGIRGMRRAAG